MGGWFTTEQIDGETFALSEYGHPEEAHCYLLCGGSRALLIDTGLGVGDLKSEVERLTSLPILVATTHVHWDHIGGHGQFRQIAVFEKEAAWLSGGFPLPLAVVRRNLAAGGCRFPEGFDPEQYRIFQGGAGRLLRDGEVIRLGGRSVQVLHTPGHSPGHCCFYEPDRGFLYTGDLIYKGCLDAFYPTTDPKVFLRSAQKAAALPARRLLPGHHSLKLPPDLAARVAAAFEQLGRAGKLEQGGGIFEFGEFQIHL